MEAQSNFHHGIQTPISRVGLVLPDGEWVSHDRQSGHRRPLRASALRDVTAMRRYYRDPPSCPSSDYGASDTGSRPVDSLTL